MPVGALVEELDRRGAVPMGAHNGDFLLGHNARDLHARLQVLKFGHGSTLVVQASLLPSWSGGAILSSP
jgi:hypothetical protein